jgi:hypothetical protein
LDHRRGSLLVRRGKGGRRRAVGMDAWAWEQLQPLDHRPGQAAGWTAVLGHPMAPPGNGHAPALRPAPSFVGRPREPAFGVVTLTFARAILPVRRDAGEVIKMASVFRVRSQRVPRAFTLLRYELVLVATFPSCLAWLL